MRRCLVDQFVCCCRRVLLLSSYSVHSGNCSSHIQNPIPEFCSCQAVRSSSNECLLCSACLSSSPPLLSLLRFSALLQWMLSAVRSPNWSHWGRPALLTLSVLTPLWFPILVPVPTLIPYLPAYLLDKCESKVLGGWRRSKELLKSGATSVHVCPYALLSPGEREPHAL